MDREERATYACACAQFLDNISLMPCSKARLPSRNVPAKMGSTAFGHSPPTRMLFSRVIPLLNEMFRTSTLNESSELRGSKCYAENTHVCLIAHTASHPSLAQPSPLNLAGRRTLSAQLKEATPIDSMIRDHMSA
mmetsp:Transcript_23690/g.58811  ORF Transcript_23690/g.58811 Transcript_23690/m.58811 type:complete len:135 (-) Transcript_23690:2616-3020(-)